MNVKIDKMAAKEFLKNLTKEERSELLKELELSEKLDNKILPVKSPDYTKLIETCEHAITEISEKGYSKDASHYIYESAMECIYGSGCWEWINENDEGC